MKLILQEYLSLLKESDELDNLLPNLLLSMSIPPLSHAQKGVRQNGVDVAAVGIDPDTNKKTLFLFVIKQGDVRRVDWSTGEQSILPSLDQVRDVYLNSNVKADHKKLPVKIILCTGGILKQEVQQDWAGYVQNNQKAGKREYDFWGGADLSIRIEKYLLNENILPGNLQSKFRKTLALLSDPDYDYSDYYSILNELLLKKQFGEPKRQSTRNKILKTFRTIDVCQNIIFHWAKSEGNLRPAIYCAERTLLNSWDVLRRYELFENKRLQGAFISLYDNLMNVYNDYAIKFQPHCRVKNAFSGYSRDYILECLTIFENLGFISSAGLLFLYHAHFIPNDEYMKASLAIADMLKNYVNNQKATNAPCYDDHIIEISMAIYLLYFFQQHQFIADWIQETVYSISFAYHRMGKYFPIQSDSFDDLVDLNEAEEIEKEKLFELSTLIPILMQWCVCLDMKDAYEFIRKIAVNDFPECTFQIWYPDKDTDEYLYTQHAASESGNVEAPMDVNISFDEMRNRMKLVQSMTVTQESFTANKIGVPFLPILASRHFRTPFFPIYWQASVIFAPVESFEQN